MPRPSSAARTTPPSRNGHAAGDTASAVAARRREQVVDAAADIIATQGIHQLSLAKIEKRAGMTRGHLTYYFPTKEDILLAVFDRMLQRMIATRMAADGPKPGTKKARECAAEMFVHSLKPPTPELQAFYSLIHTFHAQLAYRADFREKIARAHANWRQGIACDYADSVPDPPVRPAVAASILMALAQGLTGQLLVDPEAFDRAEMLAALQALVAPLFAPPREPAPRADESFPANGRYTRATKPKPPTRTRARKSDD